MKNTHKIDPTLLEKANKWLHAPYDEASQQAVQEMIDNRPDELIDAFYRDLEFGTGGLRGVMGAGTNRINKYTIGAATQGLANYLIETFPDTQPIQTAIAYDSRNNSPFFAQVAADVLSANGIVVYLFDKLRPTPELSFAIRELACQAGIVITASHNPKEYNGYKVYWNDGAQLVPPHDKNVIARVQQIHSIDAVKFNGQAELIKSIGEEIDQKYIQKIKALSRIPDTIQAQRNMKIVYTPIHGTGVELVPRGLKAFGFENVSTLEAQNTPDGNFPTVHSPNPEEPAALEMAMQKADAIQADLVMATDPDADRVGIAVRNESGKMILLNGNQTASLLIYYLMNQWQTHLTGNEYIVKTIVTSELLADIATKYQVETCNVLTGFKYIAEVIRQREGQKQFIGGGEESYGYLIGDFVRDKDAVISCCMIAETAAWAAANGKTLYGLLKEIYLEFGFYKERLLSVVRKGKAGAEEIQAMMAAYHNAPPKTINGSRLITIKDYQSGTSMAMETGVSTPIQLPQSNVIQFFTADGSIVTVRPSGTEPKIKFYFGVKEPLQNANDFDRVNQQLEDRLDAIIQSMQL